MHGRRDKRQRRRPTKPSRKPRNWLVITRVFVSMHTDIPVVEDCEKATKVAEAKRKADLKAILLKRDAAFERADEEKKRAEKAHEEKEKVRLS